MWNGIKRLTLLAGIFLLMWAMPVIAAAGQVTGTDIVAYINNYPVPSFCIDNYTAVIASDLANYGFIYKYDDSRRRVDLTYTGAPPSPLPFWRDQRTYGVPICEAAESDIQVYLNGVKIDSRNVGGLTVINFTELGRFGPMWYDDSKRAAFLVIPGMAMGTYAPVQERARATAEIRCAWQSDGRGWECILRIPVAQYDYYSSLPRGGSYADYVRAGENAGYIRTLARYFETLSAEYGLTERERLNMVTEFVRAVRYVDDLTAKGTVDYVNYPVETLFEWKGDCEDTAVLLAGVLREMQEDAVLIVFPGSPLGHMAVGIADDGEMTGTSYVLDGKTYYYLDTTEPGWDIGRLPEELTGLTPYIVAI